MLVEMWKECNKIELIPNIEKIRSFIVEKLKDFDNEDTRLFEIELACREGTSKFDAFESAIAKTPTEKMHRLYLQWLRESSAKDAFSDMKIRLLLRKICEGGWMKDKDWLDLGKYMQEAEDEYDDQFVEKCLEQRPKCATLWQVYLERRLKDKVVTDKFRDLCNQALEQIKPEEGFPIWELAIDHTIINAPDEVEQVCS
ncbi:unnamed protein product [Strongylus vulgaris]|uniref:Uncharacterized protein n=1 Tax=Strongylus vulgaris TaxID=40348 RepID=A0A3P7JJY1_STRVU|nr:unnamed protein product [Strongylus vulgaris]